MTRASGTVRSLRYALACALADTEDESGRARAPDALAEFDRALAEAGDDPPDACIHLAVGRLLEPTDPAGALERYLAALEGDAAEEGVARARALLTSSSLPQTLIASLPSDAIDSVVKVARDRPGGPSSLLASTLLRERGRDREALQLLQRTYAAGGPLSPEVAMQLAETLLDLDRIDETLALIEREDPNGRHPSLQLTRAEAQLVRGDFETALSLAQRLMEDGSAPVARVRSLSLLGLRRLDEALENLPPADAPEIHLARALVSLQRLEYPAARDAAWLLLRSRPSDPDAVIINAQTVVEALGAPREDEESAQADPLRLPGHTAGAEIDAAKALLSEVAAELPAAGFHSRWWRAQAAIRGGDGRYCFFRCLLRIAMGEALSVEELDNVDRSRTTWLQHAALDEIKAELLDRAGDRAGAAEAYDEACRIFRDSAADPQRASSYARAAYERAPTPARAARYAERALAESWEVGVDPSAVKERIASARRAAEESLGDADEVELPPVVNLLAWVRFRLAEIEIDDPVERASVLLPWFLAGLAAQPDDVVLRAGLVFALGDLNEKAAALCAAEQLDPGSESPYVAEAAVVSAANYYGDLEQARPLLERHAAVSEDENWRNAIELYLCLAAGDRDGIEQRRDRPTVDATYWGQLTDALAAALVHGIPAAERELANALKAGLDDKPPARLDAILLASVLARQDDVARYLDEAAHDPTHVREIDLQWARLIERFSFGPEMTVAEYIGQALELCRSPQEIRHLVNVELPMLAAARSGSTGPVARIAVDQHLVEARLREFDDVRARASEELEARRPGLSGLARLVDPGAGPALLQQAAHEARAVWPDELPRTFVEEIERRVMHQACDELLRRLLEALLGRGAPVDDEDLRVVLDLGVNVPRPTRLATALLAGSFDDGARGQVGADAAEEDVAAAADEILQTLQATRADDTSPEVDAVADYWTLDTVLQQMEEDSSAPPGLRDAAAATRARLVPHLDEILGLTHGESALEVPVVTPIVVELGDGLVPLVDPNQGGGRFIHELIPIMKEHILASTGVSVPGVRLRSDPTLAPDGFRIQVDEVPVCTGSAVPSARYTVSPAQEGAPEPSGELTDFRPLTGERGVWAVRIVTDEPAGESDGLTAAQYLAHRIERVLRVYLDRFLGPQEVATLVDSWEAEDDTHLVTSVLPDANAQLRLTWVMQELVGDGVPITDWRTLLTAVQEAGGITASSRILCRAARDRLRDELPGPRTGKESVPVPIEHETALLDAAAPRGDPGLEFMRWLRQTIAVHGPAITLVTDTQEGRELVSALARTENRLIATLSKGELSCA